MATTTTYGFTKPTVGGDENTWGTSLNGNWDDVDDLLDGTTVVTGIKMDDTLSVVDNADNTKVAQFQASGITTGTTRTFTFPDASGTLMLTSAIGSTVQAYDAGLADVAGLTPTDGNFIVGDGANWVAESGATVRTSLGLGTAATLNVGTSANNIVQLDGSGALPAVDGSNLTGINDWTSTSVTATTSGTTIDFTSIPPTITEIEVWCDEVSMDSTSDYLFQIGTGGSPTTSGYEASSGVSGTTGAIYSTAGFPVRSNNAAYQFSGFVRFFNITGNVWVSAHSGMVSTSGLGVAGGGRVGLAGTLDMLRITSISGTQNFDAGQMIVRYR